MPHVEAPTYSYDTLKLLQQVWMKMGMPASSQTPSATKLIALRQATNPAELTRRITAIQNRLITLAASRRTPRVEHMFE